MNAIVLIKKYFTDRLKEVDPSFKEHDQAFNTDNIGKTLFDKSFHVLIGKITSSGLKHTVTNDSVSVVVKIFVGGKKDTVTTLYDAYPTVLEFKQRCYQPYFTANAGFMKGITNSDITPSQFGTNENAMVFTVNFAVECMFGVNDDLTY